ncbi:protein kinase domain-containing protein [Pseudonocardia sp. CA-107938]|uniref:protein kinase domain-containing protein n=1 Tax=Pseudonocardia sp. CA-107938 TaxID=3240021 RepID=UPI003D8C4334
MIDDDHRVEDERFGRYVLLGLIGRGGMGEVWRAHDTVTDRVVAVKRLVTSLAADPAFVARFRRECAVAARLSDPHIVAVHDVGEIDGRLYLAMAYVEGADLGALITRDGPLPPERAVHVVEQLAAALDTAHRAGLVHRDVKPSNALVTPDWQVFLTDFGIARGGDDTAVTTTGSTIGTLDYMAPERFHDAPIDGRVDVYALACVLHEALTGQKPFPLTGPAPLMSAHLFTPPPRPSNLRPGIPAAFDAVVARGMAKNPAQRHPTAGALAAHARAALAPRATRSRRGPVAVAIGSAVVVAATATLFAVAPWRTTGGTVQLQPTTSAAAVPTSTAPPTPTARPVPIALRQPTGLATAPDGRTAYAVDDTGVTRIDIAAATATAFAPVPGYSAATTPDGTRLLVVTQDGALTVLATADAAVVGTTSVGSSASGISVSADGRTAYVATLSTVAVVDIATARVTRRLDVGNAPTGTAVGSDALYVSWVELQHGGGQLLVADPAAAAVTARVPVGEYPLDVAVAGPRVLVRDKTVVWSVDPATKAVTEVRGTTAPLALVASPDGSRAYALATGTLAVIDPATATVVEQLPAPGAQAADVPGGPGALAVTRTALLVGTTSGVLVLPR